MKKQHVTTLLVATALVSIFAATAWAVEWSQNAKQELKESKEKAIPSRSIYVDIQRWNATVDVVEIDGVEYLIASTNRGVSICRK